MERAKKREVLRLVQRMSSFYNQEAIYFLNFTSNQSNVLIAKISVELYESLIEDFKQYENILFEKSLTITPKNVRQDCYLVRCYEQ